MMPNIQPVNILFIHANNIDIGGSDFCMLKLAAALNRKKYNPFVLLGIETEIANKYRENNIPLMIIPMLRIKRTLNPFYHLKFFLMFFPTVFRIAKVIDEYQIEIVHSNDFQDFYGGVAARLKNVKSIQHCRLIMKRPLLLKKLLTYFILKLNNKIIAISDAVAFTMFSSNNNLHSKVVKCYDWLDMTTAGHASRAGMFRNELKLSKDTFLIGSVGRLEPWKGQHLFIKSAAEVLKKLDNIFFVIIGGKVKGRGREKYKERLWALAIDLGIKDKIYFTGHRTDIMNIMDGLDIYVHSSIEPEPFGLTVMEAMFLAKPVIAPREGGVLEQVIEGKTGLFYEPRNYYDMADKIVRLVNNPDLSKKMGLAGKDHVERMFSKKLLYKKFESIYSNVLSL